MTGLVENNKVGGIPLVIGGILLAADVFGLELALSQNLPIGVLYALVVVLGLWWTDQTYIITAAVAGTVLCLLGFYFSQASDPLWLGIANLGVSVFVIWMVAVLCFFHKQEKIEKRELEEHSARIGQEHCAMENTLRETRATLQKLEKETREKLQSLEKGHHEKIQDMEKNASFLQLNLLEKEAQLDQVERTLKDQEHRLKDLALKQDKKEELDRLQESLDRLLDDQQKIEERLLDKDARIEKSEEDRNRTANALWEKEQRLADVLDDLNLLENDLHDKETSTDQLEKALKQAQDQLHEKNERLRTVETRLDKTQGELQEKERLWENFEAKMLALENQSERAQKTLQDRERLLQKIEQQIHETLERKPEDPQKAPEPEIRRSSPELDFKQKAEEQNGDPPTPDMESDNDGKAQKRFRQYTRELERSNQDLGEFASIASHDLQEPIRKIIGFGMRLKKDCSPHLNDKGKDYLGRIERSAQKMQKFVDDLLQYSKVNALSARCHPVDLKEVISQVLTGLESLIEETHSKIEVGPLPVIECDRMQMAQLFQNLISNALKFHKKGEPPVVRISHRLLENGFHEIRVQDQGIGFDEKDLDRIFKPFERLYGNSEYEGTGMGLAICQKIVLRQGGTLTAQSSATEGTTFIVTLPPSATRKKA